MTISTRARILAVAGAAVAAACSGAGDAGPTGPQGAMSPAYAAAGLPTDCTPGELFCDGDTVWRCHRSGVGALQAGDCAAGGTATNPMHCAADNRCAAGDAVCCLRALPTCSWNVIQPVSVQGTVSPYLPSDSSCGSNPWPSATPPPDACGVTRPAPAPYGSYVSFTHSTSQCPPAYFEVSLSFDRTLVAPSATPITLPNAGVIMSLTDATRSCRTGYTGTVTWLSDAPAWHVLVNAACSDGAGLVITGEFWGNG